MSARHRGFCLVTGGDIATQFHIEIRSTLAMFMCLGCVGVGGQRRATGNDAGNIDTEQVQCEFLARFMRKRCGCKRKKDETRNTYHIHSDTF